MKKIIITLAVVVSGLMTLVLLPNIPPDASATTNFLAPTPPVIALSTVDYVSDCDTWCQTSPCDNGHTAVGVEVGDGNFSRNEGWHMQCRNGDCESTHGPECDCPGGDCLTYGAPEFETFRAMLAEGDAEGAGAILAIYQGQVIVNSERNAVQVVDCSGGVWAHLPVSHSLIDALATSAGERVIALFEVPEATPTKLARSSPLGTS